MASHQYHSSSNTVKTDVSNAEDSSIPWDPLSVPSLRLLVSFLNIDSAPPARAKTAGISTDVGSCLQRRAFYSFNNETDWLGRNYESVHCLSGDGKKRGRS